MPETDGATAAGGPPAQPVTPPSPPTPPPAPPLGGPVYVRAEEPRRRPFWRRLLGALGILLFVFSLMLNVLLVMVLAVSSLAAPGLETAVTQSGADDQVVAVYAVTGILDADHTQAVKAFCRTVRRDKNIQAVVLRVDSPGGGISACDQMYQAIKSLRQTDRKLVVSMGGVAASGGYYISSPAQTIFAEPTTVTGSIGVLASWPVLKGALDKLGMKWMILRSSPTKAWKATPNIMEEPAQYQIAELQGILDDMQARFEAVVREQRGTRLKVRPMPGRQYKDASGQEFTVDEVEPFNGRVFLADRAVRLGLVDEVGYLQDAIDEAARLAGLTKPKVVMYSQQKSVLEKMGFADSSAMSLGTDILERAQTPQLLMLWQVDH